MLLSTMHVTNVAVSLQCYPLLDDVVAVVVESDWSPYALDEKANCRDLEYKCYRSMHKDPIFDTIAPTSNYVLTIILLQLGAGEGECDG